MAVALPYLAIASIVGGGVLAAKGAHDQGNAQYQQAYYQAAISDNNSQIAKANAADAIARGKVDEANQRRNTTQVIGNQRAGLASLGQVLDTGTAGKVVGDSVQQGEADALTVRRNAERQALNFSLQSQNFTDQATLDRMGGSSAQSAGNANALGTILTTGAKAYSSYSTLKAGGSFS